jgi:hypothetical protein
LRLPELQSSLHPFLLKAMLQARTRGKPPSRPAFVGTRDIARYMPHTA